MNSDICNKLPDDVKSQLNTLETSKFYIILIIAGILISLGNINLQENQIICSALSGESCECPCLFPRKITSNIIIMAALVFFYDLSKSTAESLNCTDCSANFNLSASTLTLMAVIIRLIDLLNNQN